MNELNLLAFSVIFKYKIYNTRYREQNRTEQNNRTENKTIKYKKQKYKMQKMQNTIKIIESTNITKNIVLYERDRERERENELMKFISFFSYFQVQNIKYRIRKATKK